MGRISRVFRRRPGYYTGLVGISLLGTLIIGMATLVGDLPREVMINLGASVLGVVLTAIVLEPLIERARRPEEVIHAEFPYQSYMAAVDDASQRIRIMSAWPYVMDYPWRGHFLTAVEGALSRGVTVQILVLDPLSKAAEQRAFDLNDKVDVSSVISDVLQAFNRFQVSVLESSPLLALDIRVYSSQPPARLYRWDNRALSSFFPMGSGVGTDVRHYETNVTSGLGRFVDEQFDLIWQDNQTEQLNGYLFLSITLTVTSKIYTAQYVLVGEELFAATLELGDDVFRNLITDLTVHLHVLPAKLRETAIRNFKMQGVPDDDDVVAAVSACFERKYGAASALQPAFRAVFRLVPCY